MAPIQKPGRSRQDYQTPVEFIYTLQQKLGIGGFIIDLAASIGNAIVPRYYTEEDNALVQSWVVDGWGFCNPPYANIRPWVQKAWEESQAGAKVAMLVPAGVGSNWWRDWVHGKAYVLLMNGRLSFDGVAPYPKDTAILLYDKAYIGGYQVWNWREDLQ